MDKTNRMRRRAKNALRDARSHGLRTLAPSAFALFVALLTISLGAWMALGDSRLTTTGKQPGIDFGIDTAVVRVSGDTIHFFTKPFYMIRNTRFKSGHIDRCEVAQIGLEFSPAVSVAAVSGGRIAPFTKQKIVCELHFKLALNVYYPMPEWQMALYADDGTEVLRTRLFMPMLPECKAMQFSPTGPGLPAKPLGFICAR